MKIQIKCQCCNGLGKKEYNATSRSQWSLGRALRRRRIDSGLTLDVLSERSGVSVRTIYSIEHGLSEPRFDTINAVLIALDHWGK